MKTFEESIANITAMQDSWLEYYDEDGNLCDKDGNIIEPAQPTPEVQPALSNTYVKHEESSVVQQNNEQLERYF